MADKPIPEMVERVGNAVREEFLRQGIAPWRGMDFSGVNPPVDWAAIGYAALTVAREPTETMGKAAAEYGNQTLTRSRRTEGNKVAFEFSLYGLWRAMIAAALGE